MRLLDRALVFHGRDASELVEALVASIEPEDVVASSRTVYEGGTVREVLLLDSQHYYVTHRQWQGDDGIYAALWAYADSSEALRRYAVERCELSERAISGVEVTTDETANSPTTAQRIATSDAELVILYGARRR